MDFIKSQNISEKLTHVMPSIMNYFGIKKYGIRQYHREHMLWKPKSFWISMNHDWERWCYGEDFGNISESVICNVKLKKDLKLLKVTTVDDAENLAKILMPDMKSHRLFNNSPSIGFPFNRVRFADMLTMTIYITDKLKEGKLVGSELWDPITKNYDGIYYLNSNSLHFETFFNTWDCHSIALFDGSNATLTDFCSNQKLIDEIKKDFSDE